MRRLHKDQVEASIALLDRALNELRRALEKKIRLPLWSCWGNARIWP